MKTALHAVTTRLLVSTANSAPRVSMRNDPPLFSNAAIEHARNIQRIQAELNLFSPIRASGDMERAVPTEERDRFIKLQAESNALFEMFMAEMRGEGDSK